MRNKTPVRIISVLSLTPIRLITICSIMKKEANTNDKIRIFTFFLLLDKDVDIKPNNDVDVVTKDVNKRIAR